MGPKHTVAVVGALQRVGVQTVRRLGRKFPTIPVLAMVDDLRDPLVAELRVNVLTRVLEIRADNHQGLRDACATADICLFVLEMGQPDAKLHAVVRAMLEAKKQRLVVVSVGAVLTPAQQSLLANPQLHVTKLIAPLALEQLDEAESILAAGRTAGPLSPDTPHTAVALRDVAAATVAVLAHPKQHIGRSFTLTGKRSTRARDARDFSRALGHDVAYLQLSLEDVEARLKLEGASPDAAGRLVAVFRSMEQHTGDAAAAKATRDVRRLSGRDPTSPKDWLLRETRRRSGALIAPSVTAV